jgi:Glu-tRNA(Gln) amidotransferase subunit E-like FAD-binding protein
MESSMLQWLKTKNSDKEYPSNLGQKWSDEEEILLLEELSKNIDIQLIAQSHNRTIGGINARRKQIVYKLYSNNISIEEIILKTKLEKDQIIEIIKRRQNNPTKSEVIEIKKLFSIESEIDELKNDIKEVKNTLKELVEMMKAVYEFEDA